MSIRALADNALFIRNFKERMRAHMVGSSACIVLLIILLIFIGNYLNQDALTQYNYAQKKSVAIPWLNNALFQLAVLQGVILFLFGTFSAGKMAGLEKSSGTLDFHRCAPVARINQIIGLIFGAPILEWCLFFATLVISVVAILISQVDIVRTFLFYLSLIFSALFFHSLSVLCAIYANPKRYRAGSILLVMYLFSYWAFMLSSIYHATPFPAYGNLYNLLLEQGASIRPWDEGHSRMMHSFFGHTMPYLLMQIMVQVPLILLFWAGIKRKFAYGEKPVWSKVQSAIFFFLVLFYFTGSIAGIPLAGKPYQIPQEVQVIAFWFTTFVLMFILAPSATPTQLAFIKGLYRARKIGKANLGAQADQSSNWLWLIVFCLTSSVMFFIISALYLFIPAYKIFVFLTAGLCYIIFFCSLLEYFNLSKYHQKKPILITALIILWFVIPIFALVTKIVVTSPNYLQYFFAPSPFFGMGLLSSILDKHQSAEDFAQVQPAVFIVITALFALSALLLAQRERTKLVNTILENSAPKN